MTEVIQAGGQRVIGFEANGGTLLGNDLASGPKLERLMTRDAVLPLLGTIGLAARQKKSVADLVDSLPLRTARSDRLESVQQAHSAAFLEQLRQPEAAAAHFRPHGVTRTAPPEMRPSCVAMSRQTTGLPRKMPWNGDWMRPCMHSRRSALEPGQHSFALSLPGLARQCCGKRQVDRATCPDVLDPAVRACDARSVQGW